MDSPIPVTLLSGFLGSGKTTLLKKILEGDHGYKIAVIINDLASVNIDAKLIQNKDININQSKEKVVQLENGCACCTLRSDLVEQLVGLAYSKKYDYILIEGSGLSEPMSIAQTFTPEYSKSLLNTYATQMEAIKSGEVEASEVFDNDDTKQAFQLIAHAIKLGGLDKIAKLDTAVTVVDSFNFLSNYESFELATTSDAAALSETSANSSITDLLIQQIEFADVVVVNKVSDLKDKEVLNKIRKIVSTLNPHAKVFETDYCSIDLKEILNTNLFSFERISKMPSWIENMEDLDIAQKQENEHEHEHKDDHDHEHCTDHDHHHEHDHEHGENCGCESDNHIKKYGINSFIYKSKKPFHPGRLQRLLRDKFMLIKPEADDDEDEEEDEEEEGESKEPPTKKLKSDMLDHDFAKLSHKELIENKKQSIFKDVIRLKGFIWLASSIMVKCEVGGSGQLIKFQPSGQWFNKFTLPALLGEMLEPPVTKESLKEVLEHVGIDEKVVLSDEFGDCSNEIVFIGFDLDKAEISKEMDKCLLTDAEFDEYRYVLYDFVCPFEEDKAKLQELKEPESYKEDKEELEEDEPFFQAEYLLENKFLDGYTNFV